MMFSRFFIFKDTIFFFVAVTFIIFYFFSFNIILTWFLYLSVYFTLYRRKKINYKDRIREASNFLVSPVNGKILSIDTNSTLDGFSEGSKRIRIKINPFDEWGVYFPFSSVVEGFYENLDKNKTTNSILLKNTSNQKVMLQAIPSLFGLKGNFWVNSGDIGKACSCLGYLPFGGVVELVVEGESDFMVSTGERVNAGDTVLATIKE